MFVRGPPSTMSSWTNKISRNWTTGSISEQEKAGISEVQSRKTKWNLTNPHLMNSGTNKINPEGLRSIDLLIQRPTRGPIIKIKTGTTGKHSKIQTTTNLDPPMQKTVTSPTIVTKTTREAHQTISSKTITALKNSLLINIIDRAQQLKTNSQQTTLKK